MIMLSSTITQQLKLPRGWFL